MGSKKLFFGFIFLLAACSPRNDSSSQGPDTDLVFLQNMNSSIKAAGGEYTLNWHIPYSSSTAPVLTPSGNWLYATEVDNSQMDCSSSQKITPVVTSLTPKLNTPKPGVNRILLNGQIIAGAADYAFVLTCDGKGNIRKDYLAADEQTTMYSLNYTNFATVPLSGLVANSPAEFLSAYPLQRAIEANYFPMNGKWNKDSSYTKHKTTAVTDFYLVQDCPVSGVIPTPGTKPTACGSGNLEEIFPFNNNPQGKPSEFQQWSDGTVSTVQGLRTWTSNLPLPETNGVTYRIFFELNSLVYAGTLTKAGQTFAVSQSDGSDVDFAVTLNASAILSVASEFIVANGVVGQTSGSDLPIGQCLDLFNIGGHGINGSLAPQDIRQHYSVPANLNGSGQTIAIVDAPASGDIFGDLNVMSAHYGLPILPKCTNPAGQSLTSPNSGPCYQHIDLSNGAPISPQKDWGSEAALDLQASHGMAPQANLVLVTAASNSNNDLAQAVQMAAQIPGVVAVSMSFSGDGGDGYQTQARNAYLPILQASPGVVFLASTGDSGALGSDMGYPAAMSMVTAVGGTRIQSVEWKDNSSETVWTYSGGGEQGYEPMPDWQRNYLSSLSSFNGLPGRRIAPDVAAVADFQHSPFAIYAGERWGMTGGTSLSAPLWAGMTALIAQAVKQNNSQKTLGGIMTALGPSGGGFNMLMYAAKTAKGTSVFHDIISGSNNLSKYTCADCVANAGYNGITGLGTPNLTTLIQQILAQP